MLIVPGVVGDAILVAFACDHGRVSTLLLHDPSVYIQSAVVKVMVSLVERSDQLNRDTHKPSSTARFNLDSDVGSGSIIFPVAKSLLIMTPISGRHAPGRMVDQIFSVIQNALPKALDLSCRDRVKLQNIEANLRPGFLLPVCHLQSGFNFGPSGHISSRRFSRTMFSLFLKTFTSRGRTITSLGRFWARDLIRIWVTRLSSIAMFSESDSSRPPP